jgi:hypothetical protein
MYEVKKVEAYGLLADLRNFACEQSTGFASGRQNGFEVTKNFYHVDPVPPAIADKVSPEMCKSAFGFEAFRVQGHRSKKPGYTYGIWASLERTLPAMPRHILSILPEDTLHDYGSFEELEEGALMEGARIDLEASTYELRQITVGHTYEITYAGDTIYSASDDDILFSEEGVFATVPSAESLDDTNLLYIPDKIDHEKIDGPDNVPLNTEYWSIVDPYGVGGSRQIASYQSAAARIQTILQALRTGNIMY